MPHPLPCVIFAGGKSSRMGRDKALLPFGGYDTLAEYQYRRLLPLFSAVYISTKQPKFPFDAPLIEDAADVYAPTAGFLAAFRRLRSDFFALAVDTPLVGEAQIAALVRAYREGGYAVYAARSPSGTHPVCGIYTLAVERKMAEDAANGRYRLHGLLKEVPTRWVTFDSDEPFVNLNTPAEYASATGHR